MLVNVVNAYSFKTECALFNYMRMFFFELDLEVGACSRSYKTWLCNYIHLIVVSFFGSTIWIYMVIMSTIFTDYSFNQINRSFHAKVFCLASRRSHDLQLLVEEKPQKVTVK